LQIVLSGGSTLFKARESLMTTPADRPQDNPQAKGPTSAGANTVPWPPILYAATLLLAYLAHWLWPLAPLIGPPVSGLLGLPMLVSGIAFGAAAIVRFRVLGTPIDPTSRATRLATGGIYRLSRNPMYVGAVIALLGLGLGTLWTWLIVLSLLLPVALYKLAIEREEAYLQRHFGAEYHSYCARVRRWI
jgi:protein-S-isoprenylcysteine O-methyltransferase Ste14